jgi:hypothetical protein
VRARTAPTLAARQKARFGLPTYDISKLTGRRSQCVEPIVRGATLIALPRVTYFTDLRHAGR